MATTIGTLPSEILNCIFLKLHQLEKRECMLVCRGWYEYIRKWCLLDTIVLTSGSLPIQRNHQRLEFLIEQIQNNEITGYHTQRLLLQYCYCNHVGMEELATSFPNLRLFYIQNSILKIPRSIGEEEPLAKWLGQLERIYDYSRTSHIQDLLSYPIQFNQLVSLSISGDRREDTLFLASLKSAPVLKTLQLEGFDIELHDIEKIHENTSLLTTLILLNVQLMMSQVQPPIPKTVEIMDTFSFRSVKETPIEVQQGWLFYIADKYKDLKEFIFETRYGVNIPLDEEGLTTVLPQSLSKIFGKRTKTLHINTCALPSEILTMLDECGVQLEKFKLLLEKDTRYPSEDLCYFSRKDVLRNLHTLEICQIDRNLFYIEEEIPNLKHLTLEFKHSYDIILDEYRLETLGLDMLLNQCPDHLESLCINNVRLTTKMHSSTTAFKNLKSLKLESCDVEEQVPKFLSTHCPNLNSFLLIGNHLEFKTVDLPLHDIDLFEIDTIYVEDAVVITNKKENTTRSYLSKLHNPMFNVERERNRTLYRGIEHVSFDEVKDKLLLYFTCHSLNTFIMDGRIAV